MEPNWHHTDYYRNNCLYINEKYFSWKKQKCKSNKFKSHFINIPIEDEKFIKSYNDFCMELKNKNLSCFSEGLLQKPGKLHMTICVLSLEYEENVQRVDDIISGIIGEIQSIICQGIKFNFEKFETMGSPKSTRVIYAKMKNDQNLIKLEKIVHLIIQTLIDKKVLSYADLKMNHINYDKLKKKFQIKLHLTLFNVMFLNKILKKKREKLIHRIDASDLLNYLNNKSLPSAGLKSLNFDLMRENKITEKYISINSYKLN